MVRRRTATFSLTAAALVLAAPLITSCAAEHPGSAAVVGGRAITVTELQNRVTQLRSAQAKAGQDVDLSGAKGGLSRAVLTGLLDYQVLDRAAADHHVTVTRRQTKALEALYLQRYGSAAALRAALMQIQVAPGQPTDAFARSMIQKAGVAKAIGVDPTTPQGVAALNTELGKAAQALHVDVNPRYGTWSAASGSIANATSGWLRPATEAEQQQPAAVTG
ncbi:SurA N-terminal domain-containing protein [Streptomyces sp. SL13]|uniref:SurA N-terminal domain-containing protein n=1 Tax=Streptantibioticus silvisoli TaxID=2705255 RepID=A0AA90HA23_9ACTN|nr:SurA N-terminal domain-containing protein [Streptantibioticus silvisoli]MDI5972947.1 SurA N-terminal domain-containing protein [Streptantibioticus silvisoli]